MGSVWCCFTYMQTMEYDTGVCLFLWSGKSNHLTTSASAFVLVNWSNCSDFAKYMSLPCTSKHTLGFLSLVEKRLDRLIFRYIICHGTIPVIWCLSPQVLDQKYFDVWGCLRAKNLIEFSLFIRYISNKVSLWFWQMVKYHFCFTLEVIWWMRKDIKLDIAIINVCYWFIYCCQYLEASLKRM